VSWWQLLLLCWFCYLAGFFTVALMVIARDDQPDDSEGGLPDD